MTYFETKFGHKIEFVPGYFQRHLPYLQYMATQESAFANQKSVRTGMRMPFTAPAKDFVNFSALMRFMNSHDLIRTFDRGIDIGGAEGTCIALTKASGLIEHATNLDIADYSSMVESDYFDEMIKFIRGLDLDQGTEAGHVRTALSKAKQSFDYYPEMPPPFGLYNDFPASATVDEFCHVDFRDATGKYDLITSYATFEHFELSMALAKVRDLLTDDGLFVCMDGYWWFPMNSAGVVGNFPYCSQRLCDDDLERYLTEHHPDMSEFALKRLQHIHGGERLTINDWFSIARKNELRPIAIERIVPKYHHRIADEPSFIFLQPNFNHEEVLRDIHYSKPDVTVDDLFTSAFRIAMVPM